MVICRIGDDSKFDYRGDKVRDDDLGVLWGAGHLREEWFGDGAEMVGGLPKFWRAPSAVWAWKSSVSRRILTFLVMLEGIS